MKHKQPPSDRNREDAADHSQRWVRVGTAPDQLVAEMWQQAMRDRGIPARLAPADTMSFLGLSANPVGVMVPLGMRARAERVLAQLGGPAPLTDTDDPS